MKKFYYISFEEGKEFTLKSFDSEYATDNCHATTDYNKIVAALNAAIDGAILTYKLKIKELEGKKL